MKKVFYFSMMVMAMFLMTACSSSPATPGDALKKYSEFLQSGDYENFVEGLAFEENQDAAKVKEQKEALVAMLKEKVDKEYEKKGGIKDIEILSEEVAEDGNTAVVKTRYTYGNGETEEGDQQMVKKDGKWLMSVGK